MGDACKEEKRDCVRLLSLANGVVSRCFVYMNTPMFLCISSQPSASFCACSSPKEQEKGGRDTKGATTFEESISFVGEHRKTAKLSYPFRTSFLIPGQKQCRFDTIGGLPPSFLLKGCLLANATDGWIGKKEIRGGWEDKEV